MTVASVRKRTWGNSTNRKVGGRLAGSCWEVSWIDNGQRRKKSGFKTKADAEAFAVERQKEVNDGVSRPAGHRKTLDELIKAFLDHNEDRVRRGVISAGHVINQKGHFTNYICRKADWEASSYGKRVKPFSGAIGHLQISRIRTSTILKLRDDLFLAGLKPGGVRQIIISLSSAFEYARGLDYIATNPASRIPIERSLEEQVKRVTPPSIKTVHSVIANSDGMLRLAIEVSACTGIRAGELRALRYRSINSAKRIISIKAAVSVGGVEGSPKSLAGIRDIPISPMLMERIEHHRATQGNPPRGALVFQPEDGREFLPPSWLRYRLVRVLEKLGLANAEDLTISEDEADDGEDEDEDETASSFSWHALRHFAISSWIAQGIGLKAVQTYAGHADVTTTWNRYGHLFPDEAHWSKIDAATEQTLTLPT